MGFESYLLKSKTRWEPRDIYLHTRSPRSAHMTKAAKDALDQDQCLSLDGIEPPKLGDGQLGVQDTKNAIVYGEAARIGRTICARLYGNVNGPQ